MSVSFNLGIPPAAAASKTAHLATSVAASKTAHPAASKTAHPPADVPAASAPPHSASSVGGGGQQAGSNKRGARGKGGGGQVAQLASEVKNLKAELASIKTASAATDARLDTVSAKVDKTNSNIDTILAMMQEDRKQRAALPPPPARPAIMPPTSTLRSPSPPPTMTLVTSGREGSIGQMCGHWVPTWGSSTSGSSTGPYTGQNGWADKAAAVGAMVVAKSPGSLPSPSSLSKKKDLPSPSSLHPESSKKAGMSGSGLVRCSDPNAFLQALKTQGWNQMLKLLQSSNQSVHLLTAGVNACYLSENSEAVALAIACFDRARPATAFEPHLRDTMRAAFDPQNPAFKQFCMRMAEFCSRSPEKGIKYCEVTYSYPHLVQNDEHRKELIEALRDN